MSDRRDQLRDMLRRGEPVKVQRGEIRSQHDSGRGVNVKRHSWGN